MKPLLLFLILAGVSSFASFARADRPELPGAELPGDLEGVLEAAGEAKDAVDREVIEEQRRIYEAERKVLREALKAEIEALGQRANRQELDAVVARFKLENAALIEAQRVVAEVLREAAEDARDEARDKLPKGVKEMKDLLKASKDVRKKSRDDFKLAFAAAASAEERRDLLRDHLAAQRDHHRQMRDDLKKLREELRNRHIEDLRRPSE